MPRYSRADASSSENESSDAPESISLSQSKKNVQRLESDRRNAEVIQRKTKKDKNREMDRKLKERAAINQKGKESIGKIEVGGNGAEKKKRRRKVEEESQSSREPDELEKRMQRAMQEAEEEAQLENDGGEFMGINVDEAGANEEEDEDASGNNGSNSSGRDDDASDEDETTVGHPDHLPDELFAAAFRSSSKRKTIEVDAGPTRPAKKRKSSKKEDIVVGSRAIRVLSNSSAPPVPSTTPSHKINKFLDRSLALSNGKQNLHTKGWERRPVNIGLFKRDGPAVSFVRNR